MPTEFQLPAMGFDMTEGKIARWAHREGDRVEPGELLAEIGTEKVNLELVDHPGGVIEKLLVSEGETVPVGTPIVLFAEGGTASGSANPPPTSAPQSSVQTTTAASISVKSADHEAASRRPAASPLARKLADEKGVDLHKLQGSGPMGRIVRDDVLEYLQSQRSPTPGSEHATREPDAGSKGAADVRPSAPRLAPGLHPLSPMRQAIARRLQESKRQIPHFYLTTDVRMDRIVGLREDLKHSTPELRITINDFVLKATAVALTLHPSVNAWYLDGKVQVHEKVNLGVAVPVEDGLVVPALMDCAASSLTELANSSRELAERARKGSLRADEFSSGTFSISNLGMYGVTEFQAIINPPQVGILAVGAVQRMPVIEGEGITIGSVMQLCLSCDHRVVDGVAGAQFLADVKRLLQTPLLLLV